MASASQTFDDVALSLQTDPDDDVTVSGAELLVHGEPFARFDGELLHVLLPATRADDLVTRGMAKAAADGWVTVEDQDDWLELASEAHQFVGEPPVGRQS